MFPNALAQEDVFLHCQKGCLGELPLQKVLDQKFSDSRQPKPLADGDKLNAQPPALEALTRQRARETEFFFFTTAAPTSRDPVASGKTYLGETQFYMILNMAEN